jgi:hypothetical protein
MYTNSAVRHGYRSINAEEIINANSENHTKHLNASYRQKHKVLNVKSSGTSLCFKETEGDMKRMANA